MSKLCLDCGAVTTGASRCPTHKRVRDRARNSASFYTTRAWRRLRAQCIARDGASLLSGSTYRLTAHHVIPREQGGPDHLDNLVTLAGDEHSQYEADVRHDRHTPLRRQVDELLERIATARRLTGGVR